jgi:hypothetical protein
MSRRCELILVVAAIVLGHAPAALALPTMIRLGYTGCATCHLAPQGGGPLNPYGKSIDEAQSLRGGEYRPRDTRVIRALSWNRRIAQDLRLVLPMQRTWSAHDPVEGSVRARLQYRNFTQLPKGFAVHVVVTGETDDAPRPIRAYDPAIESSSPVLNAALVQYRIRPGLEVAAGRDQLPVGVNVPDTSLFFRSRNRLGFYDSPTQIRLYWEGKHHRVIPYAFGPGGNEPSGEAESGGGAIAEFDVFGNGHSMVGVDALHGESRNGSRQVLGVHARLGFGAWGILAQHDITDRDRDTVAGSFRQQATYGHIFWAAREWLVFSGIGERLSVETPFDERRNGGAIEVAARLTSIATVGASFRVAHDPVADRLARSITLQLALKTVY